MPETLKQFYLEPDCFEGEALVQEISDNGKNWSVVLDRSLFYPEGGGQPCDLGSIDGIALTSVDEGYGKILHILECKPSFMPGDRVVKIGRAHV